MRRVYSQSSLEHNSILDCEKTVECVCVCVCVCVCCVHMGVKICIKIPYMYL